MREKYGILKKKLEKKLSNLNAIFTLESVFHCMKSCGVHAIIINIDEADKTPNDILIEVLRFFGWALCNGAPIYFTVTGIYNDKIFQGISGTRKDRLDITLPPLNDDHVKDILTSLKLNSKNILYNQLIWLCGGIPRYIEYLIHSMLLSVELKIYSIVTNESIVELKRFIDILNARQFNQIVSTWKNKCIITERNLPNQSILSNIVALSISEQQYTNIENVKIGENYTVKNALEKELAYLVSLSNGKMKINVPPILLSSYHCCDTNPIKIDVLSNVNTVSNNRDNEGIYISVLLNRMKARRLVGFTVMLASELVGVALVEDFNIQLPPDDIQLVISDKIITRENFHLIAKANTAYLNTPTAPFADAILTLTLTDGKLVTFKIQMKQSVVVTTSKLQSKPRTRKGNVNEEFVKATTQTHKELFIYVTEVVIKSKESQSSADVCIIDYNDLMTGLGPIVGNLVMLITVTRQYKLRK